MPIKKTLKKKMSKLGKTIKKTGKYLLKSYDINKIIDELKYNDIIMWTNRWKNNGIYQDDAGETVVEPGVGYQYQNLSTYLKSKKSEVSNNQYRIRANNIIEERERNIRWRRIANRAHNRLAQQRRLETRRYDPGIEQRLETMGLSQAQIEAHPDPTERTELYRRRLLEAPTVRMTLLAEADRAHEAMMARLNERRQHARPTIHSDYDSDEGWGVRQKRKSRRKMRKTRKHKKHKNIK